MSHTKDLINAIDSGNAMETESSFNAAIAEKIAARLDDMRTNIAQNMFKTPEAVNSSVEAELAVEEGYDPERMKDGDMMGAGAGDISANDKKKKKIK